MSFKDITLGDVTSVTFGIFVVLTVVSIGVGIYTGSFYLFWNYILAPVFELTTLNYTKSIFLSIFLGVFVNLMIFLCKLFFSIIDATLR